MRITPCKNDFRVILFIEIPMLIFALAVFYFVLDSNVYILYVCIACACFALSQIIPKIIYFGRSITISDSGCVIQFGPYKREYPINDIVAWRIRKNCGITVGELNGTGMILAVRPFQKSKWFASMTYCSHFHPFKSVFLRFGPHIDPYASSKVLYDGYYTVEDDILHVLSDLNIDVLE